MSNHIGRSICRNPVEWLVFCALIGIVIALLSSAYGMDRQTVPECIVTATPVQ